MVLVLPEAPRRKNAANILSEGLASGINQSTQFAQQLGLEKAKNEMKEKKELKDTSVIYNNIIDEMESLKDNVGPFNLKALNPYSEVSGKRSQINTLRLSLEGLFRDLTLKGQFPKAIYERILKELPSASSTPEEYQNQLTAIRKILKSHEMGKGGGGAAEPMKMEKEEKAGKSSKVIDEKTMKNIIVKAKGDRDEAKRIAKKMGYTVE